MTIHLVRHGNAGRRTAGTADVDRTLDEVGQAQAAQLAAYFARAPIDNVLSSPAIRCRQTVGPLAAALGLQIEVTNALWEGQGARPALSLIQRLAAADACAILCSHGDVIPQLLDLLAAGGVPLTGFGCSKGSVWSLDVVDNRITGARYTASP